MQFDVAPFASTTGGPITPKATTVSAELLRQLLDVQRQQLEILKTQQAQMQAQIEAQNRKRSWFDRWQDEFTGLPERCREVMPVLERAYLRLMDGLVEEVRDNGEDSFESDFAVRDFVDRYGFTLAHLSGILTALTPLSEVTQNQESASEQS